MIATLYAAPAQEPITLAELKAHLRADSSSFDDGLTLTQSLAHGSHAIANNSTTHVGAWVSVAGKLAEVILSAGTNEATGTNDTKIQESDDAIIGVDWTGGAFTQVTTANDNADYKKQYTGTKSYIRTVSKVLLAACEFSTSVLTNAATTAEDALLTSIIVTSREIVEDQTRRQLMLATWDLYLNAFPKANRISLPFGNLVSVTSIKYKDSAGTETTMAVSTDYLVETNGERCGRIVLPYSTPWPTPGSLYPSNPLSIRFVCGYASAAAIPSKIKQAILMIAADLYSNREAQTVAINSSQGYQINSTVKTLLFNSILWEEL